MEWLISGIAGVVLLAFWHLQRAGRFTKPADIEQAITDGETLLMTIRLLQQHRGMSSALLAGDRQFMAQIREKQQEIAQGLPELLQLAEREANRTRPCLTPNEARLFRHHWQALAQDLGDLTVEESFSRHTALVQTLLDWLDAVGDARIRIPASGMIAPGLAQDFTHRLPTIAESLGQARALGTGVAARSSCSAVERVRLIFLLHRAESLLGQTQSSSAESAHARREVAELGRMVREQLLARSGVTVAAPAYFKQASQAIDAIYDWARHCRDAMQIPQG